MAIYTKGGDTGGTSLFDGSRVSKSTLRIELSGTIDELTSALGVARCFTRTEWKSQIKSIQHTLMIMGGEVSTPNWETYPTPITQEDTLSLEELIDQYSVELPKRKTFILPGSTKPAAFLHMARTICRRAERVAVSLHAEEPLSPQLLAYINRLSDLLFVYAALEEEPPVESEERGAL